MMKSFISFQQSLRLLTTIALLFVGASVFAQITTSSISGKVKDKTGASIPGATVLATYLPTGARYGVVS